MRQQLQVILLTPSKQLAFTSSILTRGQERFLLGFLLSSGQKAKKGPLLTPTLSQKGLIWSIEMSVIDPRKTIVTGGHFTWGEYLLLHEWNKYGEPDETETNNIKMLMTAVERYIRVPFARGLTISSGFRTAAYTEHLRNMGISAAIHSMHNAGRAVDLHIPRGFTSQSFWDWCSERWPGRMENHHATPTWVHLDIGHPGDWGKHLRFNP